jgi:hypothetical protein
MGIVIIGGLIDSVVGIVNGAVVAITSACRRSRISPG